MKNASNTAIKLTREQAANVATLLREHVESVTVSKLPVEKLTRRHLEDGGHFFWMVEALRDMKRAGVAIA